MVEAVSCAGKCENKGEAEREHDDKGDEEGTFISKAGVDGAAA